MAKSVRKSGLSEDVDDAAGVDTSNENMGVGKKKSVVAIGGNIKGLHEEIKGSYDKIEQWKKERKAINDLIKAERETMEAKGITKTAFDAAMSYVNMDADRREGFDTAYIIAREGLGAPVKGAQADLFGAGEVDDGE